MEGVKKSSVIIVLAVLAAGTGYALYLGQSGKEGVPSWQKPPLPVQRPPDEVSLPPAAPPTNAALTPDEQSVLKPLKPSASESEKQRYFTLIKQLAKESAVIDIRQCAPQPLVLKTKTGATIMVRNADTREHIVSFGENKALLVPAKESKTLPINYFKGSGVFGYGCDGSPGGVGLIFVAD